MFENIMNFFKNLGKKENKQSNNSKNAAKERLHLVLMQDRANVSADFLDLMKQEIIDVIKKYIDVDESAIDVRLTNKDNGDGTNGAPALYANIPIMNIKEKARKLGATDYKNVKNDVSKDSKKETKPLTDKNIQTSESKKEEKVKDNTDDNKNNSLSKEDKKDENKEKLEDNKEDISKDTVENKIEESKEKIKSENK